MSNRVLLVEAAFGFGPFDSPTSGDWIELTRDNGCTRLLEADWTIGRSDEFEHFPAGTASLLLWNQDRALDPDFDSGPYFGDLVPYVPVRVRSQDVDTMAIDDEFYGFVSSGWEQEPEHPGILNCRVRLVDLLAVLKGRRLPDVFDFAVLALSPVGYWVLDGDGEEVPDRAGTNDGLLVGSVSTGGQPVLPGDRESVEFSPGNEFTAEAGEIVQPARVEITRSPLVTSSLSNIEWMVTFKARRQAHSSGGGRVLVSHTDGTAGGMATGVFLYITPSGLLQYTRRFPAGGASSSVSPPRPIVGGGHVCFAGGGVLIDTASTVAGGVASTVPDLNPIGVNIGGGPGLGAVQHWDGWVGAVALFDGTLSVANRQSILDASARFAGQTADVAIGWALDRVGVPSARRNIDTGTIILPPLVTAERDVVEFLQEVTSTEGGGLYIDHRDGGKVRWTNRYNRNLATRSTTSQATFSDDPAASNVIRYPADGLDIAPNGLDGIINEVTATWGDNGRVVVSDTTSIDAYGPRSHQIQTVGTKAVAQSAAQWLVARRKDPASRVRGLTAATKTTTERDDNVQDLRIDDLASFRFDPLNLGDPLSFDVFIDGVTNSVRGVEWETSFRFAQDEALDPWLWATGLWGSTAIWG